MLAIPKTPKQGRIKPRRFESRVHLEYVATWPCLGCGRSHVQVHHLLRSGEHGMGRKSGDHWTVPLCQTCHTELHNDGNETAWAMRRGLDLKAMAKKLAGLSPCEKTRTAHNQ